MACAELESSGASRRRLRGKQPSGQGGSAAATSIHDILELEDIFCLMSSWVDQGSFLRFSEVSKQGRAAVASPEAWRDRSLRLQSGRLRSSPQLQCLLATFGPRWRRARSVVLARVQPSAAACRDLASALGSLQAADLRQVPRAGALRATRELPWLQHLLLSGHLPGGVMPALASLEVTGSMSELHLDDPEEEWSRLPELCPRLQRLAAPFVEFGESDADDWSEAKEGLWELFGSRVNEACLRHLQKLPQLRELDLSGAATLADDALRLLGGLPSLTRLLLRGMGPGITGRGLRWLADGCAPLEFLDLTPSRAGRRPCSAVLPDDVAVFRRKRPGVEVLFSN